MAAVITNNNAQAEAKRSKKMSNVQHLIVANFLLENKECFHLLTGQSTKELNGVQSGVKTKKTDGYRLLADEVNKKDPLANWDVKIAELRYVAYLRKYKDTKVS